MAPRVAVLGAPTWGLSGPEFLLGYVVALALVGTVAVLLRRFTGRRAAGRPRDGGPTRVGGVLLLLLGLVGAVRVVFGVQNGRPVGYLVILTLVTFVLAIGFLRAERGDDGRI
jgi:hypothetical protein